MARRHKNPNSRLYRILRVLFYRKRYTLVISFVALLAMIALLIYSWDKGMKPFAKPEPRYWSEISESGVLRAVTLPTSFTAFRHNDTWYGHEYENACIVAEALGLELEVVLAPNEKALVDSLFAGAADVAIWPMSYSVVDDHWFLRPTGVRWADWQCIASATKLMLSAYADSTLTDSALMLLPHYRLAVIDSTRQWSVLCDDSVRAHYDFRPFVIDTLSADGTMNAEMLTDSLMDHKVDAVMLRCNVARLMHDYYPTMEVSDTLPHSCDSLAWMVTYKADTLRSKIDSVAAALLEPGTPHYTRSEVRVLSGRRHKSRRVRQYTMAEGAISPFDDIFQRHAEAHHLDWRLMAAIGYIESKFHYDIVSSKGPIGLMQLMPQTARQYGFTREEALDPENNVEMACRLMESLCNIAERKAPGISGEDRLCFALVGYNAGIGHLFDAISLADTLGYQKHVWSDNVEHCLRLKSDPLYYNMSVVKCGRFNGAFTINYVNEVMAVYHAFLQK